MVPELDKDALHALCRQPKVLTGSLLHLNGEKLVDNNGCHGETEKHSHEKFLVAGVHSLVVDMCEVDGHEVLKMRYQGPDTDNSKITVPMSALKHDTKARMLRQHVAI